jgi:dihydropteroate synthase
VSRKTQSSHTLSSFERLLEAPRPLVMSILNVTPDSFSDGGEYLTVSAAVERALQMIAEGADIIDIGGESTRPAGKTYGDGAKRVTLEEELERVVPVIRSIIAAAPNALISIDTTKSEVARAAIESGAAIINDVSAATQDVKMLSTASSLSVPIIMMHGYGPLFTKQTLESYTYSDVVKEVSAFLKERITAATEAGIGRVVIDVGIGFAKTYKDNLKLIRAQSQFVELGVPVLLGVSRKSTIGRALGEGFAPKDRINGSLAAACFAVESGVKIIRTHDVKPTVEALRVLDAIRHAV